MINGRISFSAPLALTLLAGGLAGCGLDMRQNRWHDHMWAAGHPLHENLYRRGQFRTDEIRELAGNPDVIIPFREFASVLTAPTGKGESDTDGRMVMDEIWSAYVFRDTLDNPKPRPTREAGSAWWRNEEYDRWIIWVYDESRHFFVPRDGLFRGWTGFVYGFKDGEFVFSASIQPFGHCRDKLKTAIQRQR